MAVSIAARLVRGTYDAALRPSRFVRVDEEALQGSLVALIRQLGTLSFVFITNLSAYALPLTLAGLGKAPTVETVPFASPTGESGEAMRFLLRFAQNSLYLTGAAVATFLAFHGGVLITRSSNGVLSSLHTVIYSTSGYLAIIFTFVLYLDTAARFEAATNFVLWIQLTFIYTIIDTMGADLVLQNATRPGPTPPQGLSTQGELLVAGLAVAAGYYLYSMYLGSRVNHGSSRVTAIITVIAVLSIPVLFVIGSVIAVTTL